MTRIKKELSLEKRITKLEKNLRETNRTLELSYMALKDSISFEQKSREFIYDALYKYKKYLEFPWYKKLYCKFDPSKIELPKIPSVNQEKE